MLCFIMNVPGFSFVCIPLLSYSLCFPLFLCFPNRATLPLSPGVAFSILQAGPLNWHTRSSLGGEWVGDSEMHMQELECDSTLWGPACLDLIGLYLIRPQPPAGACTSSNNSAVGGSSQPYGESMGGKGVGGLVGSLDRSVNISYIWDYTGIKIMIYQHGFPLDSEPFSFCSGRCVLKQQSGKFRHNP